MTSHYPYLKTIATTLIAGLAFALTPMLGAHDDSMPGQGQVPPHARDTMRAFAAEHHHNQHLAAQSITSCVGGLAGSYPCSNIDLMAFLPLAQIGGGNGTDIWGWTDPLDGSEYAIMALTNGTAFVDISDPVNPVYLGHLPPPSGVNNSSWRDVKVYDNHAFIGTEALGSGLQVMDLAQLRSIASPPVTLVETTHFTGFSTSHNIVINEDTGYAYAVGTNTGSCNRGLTFIDIMTPASPALAGCFSADGYTHDAQCVIYAGPDSAHVGKEICFAYNEDTLTIVDVSNKSAPVQLSRTFYANRGYTHQGWLTDDHAFVLMDDETDERNVSAVTNTRTLMWDVSDLDNPVHFADYINPSTTSIDHNQYVVGNHVFQANYRAGLRILDISDIANGNLVEVAYFDIYPSSDSANFNGAWSVYPYFASGNVIVSGIEQGLYILRPNLGTTPNDPPVVDIVAPVDGGPPLSGNVAVRIDASDTEDAAGSLQVEWNVDGGAWQPAAWDGVEYVATWDSSSVFDGAHVMTARAIDADLAEGSDANNISTANGTPEFTVDAVNVSIESGKGNRNTGHAVVTVSDDAGAPLSGVAVTGTFSGDFNGSRNGTTDGAGQVTISTPRVKNLAFLQFCVDDATLSGWSWDIGNSQVCGDSNGGGSAFGSIAGHVSDVVTSNPITNASVSTDTGQATTSDAFGDYLLENVPVGDITVSVTASGYESQNAVTPVTDGGIAVLDFQLSESTSSGFGQVKGTVYAQGGGKLAEVTVQVQGGSSALTNKGGKYTIQNVPDGLQTVTASKSGYLSQQQDVVVTAGSTVTLEFTLAPE
ncbi:MAG: choice-of-anchor B family protein [Xanthomonadales bacterium]|nr:choice-of-anchor B family protein [Xanthomonadales bacterium]